MGGLSVRPDSGESGETGSFRGAADTYFDWFSHNPLGVRKRSSFEIRKCAFSALEARRINPVLSAVDKWFFRVFLLCTLFSPFFVMCFSPKGDRGIGWDFFGIVSTVALLAWTYGVYAFRMTLMFLSDIFGIILRILFVGMEIPFDISRYGKSNDASGGGNVAFGNLLLLILGAVFSFQALSSLMDVHLSFEIAPADLVGHHRKYLIYFLWVFCLSVLFVAMDAYVAVSECSHSETFVAASSLVHSTLPLFLGILIVSVYLAAQYFEMVWVDNAGMEFFLKSVPVEFVSGALTFQMIVSNVLFIFTKRNLVLRALYASVESTIND